ncbi:MAG: Mut7-C ubiquitin/RNAse domain-containing protein [Deltaproteobacteria bacterium]|nr:Mut7-C ubiquitin/RNAse domain-containing protein [Deltaproteobacteria bacterium]MBW2018630.1 Mut7-C ubiquitin/RNAse domain-containing protein [Deltaproteobacteria bacterium]MBW2073896.1 Mut7-C ubiquitin/RNAse domain-containing protein [Deltaproteobacteria bacterium]RLB81861.1 MAG: twitching motility protein PilT [Deltaproteobacteria bacterium]
MPQVTFRFYEELNEFLPREKRKKDFPVSFSPNSTVKEVIGSLGVPYTEVDLILVNGVSVDFTYPLEGGERVSVYPVFESFDIRPFRRLGPRPLRHVRFIADVHLGKLARYLRLFGFDTFYNNDFNPNALIKLSVQENRVLLTRSKHLLKRKPITRGILVRDVDTRMQLKSIFQRLDLYAEVRPFSRCLYCNGLLEPTSRQEVAHRLPERVKATYRAFFLCTACHRAYWKGTHFKRMSRFVQDVLGT